MPYVHWNWDPNDELSVFTALAFTTGRILPLSVHTFTFQLFCPRSSDPKTDPAALHTQLARIPEMEAVAMVDGRMKLQISTREIGTLDSYSSVDFARLVYSVERLGENQTEAGV